MKRTYNICQECKNYTQQVAVRTHSQGSFKEIGRACFSCREINITDQKGFTFIFEGSKMTLTQESQS